jgi:hypothetical protein
MSRYRNDNSAGVAILAVLFIILAFCGVVGAIGTAIYFQFSTIMHGVLALTNWVPTMGVKTGIFVGTCLIMLYFRALYTFGGMALGWFVLGMSWWQPPLIFFPFIAFALFGTSLLAAVTLLGSVVVDFFDRR